MAAAALVSSMPLASSFGAEPVEALMGHEDGENFYDLYEPGDVLGHGLSSVVRKCMHKETREQLAVKIIDRNDERLDEEAIVNEIRVLQALRGHPNIIYLRDAFVTSANYYLVFDLASGGELFDKLTEAVHFPEAKAKGIMRQIFSALAYIHQFGVVHRDMKPENILLTDDGTIKVADFGFARKLAEGEQLREFCDTPGYMSPEAVRCSMDETAGGYGMAVDEWACGVIMYTLLVGFPPFWNANKMVLLRTIRRGNFDFVRPYWDNISAEAKDLVRRLLCVDPSKRLTATEALEHPWLSAPKYASGLTPLRRFRSVAFGVIALRLIACGWIGRMSLQLSMEQADMSVYASKRGRELIDRCAFQIYAHWVKKHNDQNRAALFENFVKLN
eukprot:Opistho-1_new@90312